jgi:Gram-negative bacterial TonB protein C-terminal
LARLSIICFALLALTVSAPAAFSQEIPQAPRHEAYPAPPPSLLLPDAPTLAIASAARGNLLHWRNDERSRLGPFQIEPFDSSNPRRARAMTNAIPSVGGYFAYFGDAVHPGGIVQSSWSEPGSGIEQPSKLYGALYANPYKVCGAEVPPPPDIQMSDLTYLGPTWRPEFDPLDEELGQPLGARQVSSGAPIEPLTHPLSVGDVDPMRVYPQRAMQRNTEGVAQLACRIRADLTLQCGVVSEAPMGWGFGEAAIRAVQHAHATASPVDGGQSEGRCVSLAVPFRLSQER